MTTQVRLDRSRCFRFNHSVGLQFVNQLCVQDNERTATLVAISNKCTFTSFLGNIWSDIAAIGITHCLLHLRFSSMQRSSSTHDSRSTPFAYGMYPLKEQWWSIPKPHEISSWSTTWPTKNHSTLCLGKVLSCISFHISFAQCYVFRVLNHTHTAMASRLLRANLLAPITGEHYHVSQEYGNPRSGLVQAAIDARLEVVEGQHVMITVQAGLILSRVRSVRRDVYSN
jgi:hypothetical protein